MNPATVVNNPLRDTKLGRPCCRVILRGIPLTTHREWELPTMHLVFTILGL